MYDSRQQYKGSVITGPVFLSIDFWMPRPKSHYRTGKFAGELKPDALVYCPTTPDIDKLVRCTLDGLSVKCGGCVIADDSLVVKLLCEKRYITANEGVGAQIRVLKK